MKRTLLSMALLAASLLPSFAQTAQDYVPTAENIASRQDFAERRFGIFIHWGLYSMFAQGEWYMQDAGISYNEYSKVASGFCPSKFNAHDWVAAIKASGAGYITITSRHHDGFSMWGTKQSAYNIVDATPFGRDVLKELAEECRKQDIRLHFYYSHLDWGREDYPQGWSGTNCGKDRSKADFNHYYDFMNSQLTELLTNYGPIGGIWFDGCWDHDKGDVDWRLPEQYDLIHRLQPACLVGNNHHHSSLYGEDIQIFERDLPGENSHGWMQAGTQVSTQCPLESCETMNGMWGYKITDQNYKSTKELIHYLVSTAGKGANLLMNIGPQPNGELPATAVQRLREMGEWMHGVPGTDKVAHAETILGTTAGDIPVQRWGASTRKGDRLFLHILNHNEQELYLPVNMKIVKAFTYEGKQPVKVTKTPAGTVLTFPEVPSGIDYIVELQTK